MRGDRLIAAAMGAVLFGSTIVTARSIADMLYRTDEIEAVSQTEHAPAVTVAERPEFAEEIPAYNCESEPAENDEPDENRTDECETAKIQIAEDLPQAEEADSINDALINQGYLRDDVPLSYVLQDQLHAICETYGVPYELVLGVIDTESGFNSFADSGPCRGLMQLSKKYFPDVVSDYENLKVGVKLLSEHYAKYKSWPAALTAYNAGHDTGSRTYANKAMKNAYRWGWNGA